MIRNPEDDLEHWRRLVERDFPPAKQHLVICVEGYKAGIDTDKSSKALAIAAFFRALYDLTLLREMIADPSWRARSDDIEAVWCKYWDCRARFDFVSQAIEGPLLAEFTAELAKLKSDFDRVFGTDAMYMSPEIVVRKRTCTICGKDIRACVHLPGQVYDGLLCQSALGDIAVRSVAMVRDPQDPRCRLWPWRLKKKDGNLHYSQVVVMTAFSVVDFLREPDWAKEPQKGRAARRPGGLEGKRQRVGRKKSQ